MGTSKKKTAANPEDKIEISAQNSVTKNVGAGNIDKIRDILFGVQMKEFEKKFLRIEERMIKELKEIREDTKKSIDAVENFIKTEVESLTGMIHNAKESREDIEKSFSKEISETAKSFEKKLSSLDEQLNKSNRDIRQQLLDQSKTISEEIRIKNEDTNRTLEKVTEELDTHKVDNSTLAEMLTDMAIRLTKDPSMNFDAKDFGNE